MKKLILIASCVALFGVTSYAQQDTTKTKSTQQPTQSDQLKNRSQDDMKGWTQVQATEVPASLRTTLGGTQYAGWETGTIYRNEAGDTYSLRTADKNNPKTYYFDKNGKATKKPNN